MISQFGAIKPGTVVKTLSRRKYSIAGLAAFMLGTAIFTGGAGAEARQPEVRLYAIDCGRISVSDAGRFADDGAYAGQQKTLMVPCYLIRHQNEYLLWNTGLPQDLASLPAGKTVSGTTLTAKYRLTDQLKKLDLLPSDVKYLSLSHSHGDHIGNAGLFSESTWIVDAREREHAFRPQARADAQSFGAYAALETAKTLIIEPGATHDVFGDGSVTIISAPGHTPGHRILLVRLPKAGPVLLTGDMWHIPESRAARRVPTFNSDRAQTLASMDIVEKIAADSGGRVVREHVISDFDNLPKFPKSLR